MADRAPQRPAADTRTAADTIPRMVRAGAQRHGSALAIVDGDIRLSFVDLERAMTAVARGLVARGVHPGDRVALWAPNSAVWVVAATAVHAAGAWLVPLNTRLKGAEAASILLAAGVRTLLVADGFLGTRYLDALHAADPDLQVLDAVALPLPGESSTPSWDALLEHGETVAVDVVDDRIRGVGPDDVSDVLFTSGTTGAPKGVMLRHGASLEGYAVFAERFGLQAGDRYVIPTPFFHCFGYKAGWMASLMTGAVALPMAVFDADELLATIERERITHLPGPPTIFGAVLDHPDRSGHDLSSLRHAMIGATVIPAALVDRVRTELGVTTLSAYGLTESHALATLTAPEDPAEVVATTAGRPLPGVELRAVDDAGHDVEPGDDGELLIRSPWLMSGYLGDEEATRAAIVDGWLRTGDVGHFDRDGYLHITDRKKDLYIMGGFNVAPAEVERALARMPEVGQVAVIGVPDERFGEVGAAFVVPREGASVRAEAVLAFARERVANFKVPRHVEVVDELPLNATGKVLKDVLRARAAEQARAAR